MLRRSLSVAIKPEDAVVDPNVTLSDPNVSLIEEEEEVTPTPTVSTPEISTEPVSTPEISTEPVETEPTSEYMLNLANDIENRKTQLAEVISLYENNSAMMSDKDKESVSTLLTEIDKDIQVKSFGGLFEEIETSPTDVIKKLQDQSDNLFTPYSTVGDQSGGVPRPKEEEPVEDKPSTIEGKDYRISYEGGDTRTVNLWLGGPINLQIPEMEIELTDDEKSEYDKIWSERSGDSAWRTNLLDAIFKSESFREQSGVPADKTTTEHFFDNIISGYDEILSLDNNKLKSFLDSQESGVDFANIDPETYKKIIESQKSALHFFKGAGVSLEHLLTAENAAILVGVLGLSIAAPQTIPAITLGFTAMVLQNAVYNGAGAYEAYKEGDYDSMLESFGALGVDAFFSSHMVPASKNAVVSIYKGTKPGMGTTESVQRYADHVAKTSKNSKEILSYDEFISWERSQGIGTMNVNVGATIKTNLEQVQLNNLSATEVVKWASERVKNGQPIYKNANVVPKEAASHPFTGIPNQRINLEQAPTKGQGGDYRYKKDVVTRHLANSWLATPGVTTVKLNKVRDAETIKHFEAFNKKNPELKWKRSADGESITFEVPKNPDNLTIADFAELPVNPTSGAYQYTGLTSKPIGQMSPVEYRIRQTMFEDMIVDVLTKYPETNPTTGAIGFNADNYAGWWGKHVQEVYKGLEQSGFPEIQNPQVKKVYNMLLSITSQGMGLEPNFKAANFLLSEFLHKGDLKYSDGFKRFANKVKDGVETTDLINIDTKGMTKNQLDKMSKGVDFWGSWKDFYEWLIKEQDLTMLREDVRMIYGDKAVKSWSGLQGKGETKVRGYQIFGDKIGEMFGSMEGHIDRVPMDLWMTNSGQIGAGHIKSNPKGKFNEAPDGKAHFDFLKDGIANAMEKINEKHRKGDLPEWFNMSKPFESVLDFQPVLWVRMKHLYNQYGQKLTADDYGNVVKETIKRHETFVSENYAPGGLTSRDFFSMEVLAKTKEKGAALSPKERYIRERMKTENAYEATKDNSKKASNSLLVKWGINIIENVNKMKEGRIKTEDILGMSIKQVGFEAQRLVEILENKGVNLKGMSKQEKVDFVETLMKESNQQFNAISDVLFTRYVDEAGAETLTKKSFEKYIRNELKDLEGYDATSKRAVIGMLMNKFETQKSNIVETLQVIKAKKTGPGGKPKDLAENYASNINLDKVPMTSQPYIREVVRVLGDDVVGAGRSYKSYSDIEKAALSTKNIEHLLKVVFNQKGSKELKGIGETEWIFDTKGNVNPYLAASENQVVGVGYLREAAIQHAQKNPKDPAAVETVKKLVSAETALKSKAGRTLTSAKMKINARRSAELGKELQDVLGEVTKGNVSTWMDKALEYNRNMKLMSISSVTKSTLGNLLHQVAIYGQKAYAGPIDYTLNKVVNAHRYLTGKPILDRRDRFSLQLIARMEGQWHGKVEASQTALRMLKGEESVVKNKGLYDRDQYSDIKAIDGKWGELVRLPQQAQGAIDIYYRTMNEYGLLRELAYIDAMNRKVPFDLEKGSKFQKSVDQFLENPTAEQLAWAAETAEYSTFQNRQYGIMETLNRLRTGEKMKAGQLAIPFYNTFANILRVGVQHTPLTFLDKKTRLAWGDYMKGFKEKYPEGQVTGPLSDQLGKVATGATVLQLIDLFANMSDADIEGSWSGKTIDERNWLLAQGKDQYTVGIKQDDGSTDYYSYLGYEPLSTAIRYEAGLNDLEDKNKVLGKDDPFFVKLDWEFDNGLPLVDIGEKAGLLTKVLLYDFMENPVFQGVDDFRDIFEKTAVEGDGAYGRRAVMFFADQVRSFVMPNIFSQTRAISDPVYRQILIDNEESLLSDPNEQLGKAISGQIPTWAQLDQVISTVEGTDANYPRLGAFGDMIERKAPLGAMLGLKWWTEENSERKALYEQFSKLGMQVNWDPSDLIKDIPMSEDQKFLYKVGAGTMFYKLMSDSWIDNTDPDNPKIKDSVKEMNPASQILIAKEYKNIVRNSLIMQLFPMEQVLGEAYRSGDYLMSMDILDKKLGDDMPLDAYNITLEHSKEVVAKIIKDQRANNLNNAEKYGKMVNNLMTKAFHEDYIKEYLNMKGFDGYIPYQDFLKYPNMTVKDLEDPSNEEFNKTMQKIMYSRQLLGE